MNVTNFSSKLMKRISLPIIITSLLLFISLMSFGQRNSYDRWFVDVNVGPTIFIGDIRSADFIPSFKKPAEIGFAFGSVFGKELNDYINIRSQFVYGSLSGVKPVSDFHFKSHFYSAGLGLELNLNQLFLNDNRSDIHVFGTLGASYLGWNADLYKTSTGILVTNNKDAALAIPIGLKMSYELSSNLFLNLEGTLFVVTSDQVDAKPGGIVHDDINYNYLGLTYKFDKKRKRRKGLSRSRIAQKAAVEPEAKKSVAEAETATEKVAVAENQVASPVKTEAEKAAEAKVFAIAERERKAAEEKAKKAKAEEEIIAKVIKQEQTEEINGVEKHNVEYKVSLLNTKTKRDPLALQKKLGIPEKIVETKNMDGSYCYSVGSFDKIWKAKELRNRLITESNVRSARVILCKGEKSLSLVEAFNITVEAQKKSVDITAESDIPYKVVKLEHNVPSSGLVFGVQILSVKKEYYPVQMLKDLYDIQGNLIVDKTTAWARFIVTGYSTYEEALKDKPALQEKGFIDAFIVAYFNGHRIPPSRISHYLIK
jgi:hypothetical protein